MVGEAAAVVMVMVVVTGMKACCVIICPYGEHRLKDHNDVQRHDECGMGMLWTHIL